MIKLTRKSFQFVAFSIWSFGIGFEPYLCYIICVLFFFWACALVCLIHSFRSLTHRGWALCYRFIYGSVWFCRIVICRHNVWSCLSGANMLKIITFIFITFLSDVCVFLFFFTSLLFEWSIAADAAADTLLCLWYSLFANRVFVA